MPKGIFLTGVQKELIINLIKEGKTYNEIIDIFPISKSVISSIVKKNNLIYTLPSNKIPQYDQILEMGLEGKTPIQISKELNLPYGTVGCILSTNNIKFRPQHNNVRYFQTIDNHTKAYFLGFIAADGCLQDNGNGSLGLSITIHNQDRHLLKRLKLELDSNLTLMTITTKMSHSEELKDHIRLALFNKNLYEDIVKYGITPRKSLTLINVLVNIPSEFRKSFILGYFDGNGSVIFQNQVHIKNNKSYPSHGLTIMIRSTKELLSGIVEELDLKDYGLSFDKTWKLLFSKKEEIVKLFDCYKNLDIFLPRKRDRFLERMSHTSWNKFIQVQTISLPSLKIV